MAGSAIYGLATLAIIVAVFVVAAIREERDRRRRRDRRQVAARANANAYEIEAYLRFRSYGMDDEAALRVAQEQRRVSDMSGRP